MNQCSSLLEEELCLLRGRDDTYMQGVQIAPVYNRLYWNFTNAITGGEVAYALNYNIRDEYDAIDGELNESDAKHLYPQGHGDAWGHYMTAMQSYYQLLRNPSYGWLAVSENILVGGTAVTVDYRDERKFAEAAAAKARTGAEIIDLTYRAAYTENPAEQWQGYKDEEPERALGCFRMGATRGGWRGILTGR